MGEIIQLVDHHTSKETVDLLLSLLADARAGQVVGLAYIALHKGHEYEAGVTGTAKTSPLLTIGMMRILEQRLALENK